MKFVFPLLSYVLLNCVVIAQDAASTDENSESAKLRSVMDRMARRIEVSPVRDDSIVMESKSALRWVNDERDSHSAGLIVFSIDRGMPAAMIATYSWAGNLYYEFDSLSREPLVAKIDSKVVWRPKRGIRFQAIPGAPKIEGTTTARLRQMKVLSEQFEASMMGWRPDKSDRAELRRLPRELYRYQPESTDVIDGAVFAFVMGTDPEAMLLIEAFKTDTHSEWQYAFIRQTSGELQGRHNNNVVWTAEMTPPRSDPSGVGLSMICDAKLKDELAK